jgi:hypothetical protein
MGDRSSREVELACRDTAIDGVPRTVESTVMTMDLDGHRTPEGGSRHDEPSNAGGVRDCRAAAFFALVGGFASAGLIPGGGPTKSDCYAELSVDGITNPSDRVQKNKTVLVTDGDVGDTGPCGRTSSARQGRRLHEPAGPESARLHAAREARQADGEGRVHHQHSAAARGIGVRRDSSRATSR